MHENYRDFLIKRLCQKMLKSALMFTCILGDQRSRHTYFLSRAAGREEGAISKGNFYSESTYPFVTSLKRHPKLFPWTWILKLFHFKWLKLCLIRTWSCSEGSNKASFCYLSLQSSFNIMWRDLRPLECHNFRFRKIIWFV